ncbi:MAG: Rne/Rng family ribonuclease [Verrucomicrobiota bacterium]
MKQLLINSESLETRIAMVKDGQLSDYFVERNDVDRLVGSIFKSRIRNMEPSLQAAFVDIGTDKNAFLHYWDMIPASEDLLEEQALPRKQSAAQQKAEEAGQPRPHANVKQDRTLGLISRITRKLKGEEIEQPRANKSNKKRGGGRGGRGGGKGGKKNQQTVPVEDIPELFRENSEILVQVTKGPIGTKGARVTTNLSIAGRYLVLLPNSTHVGVSKRIDDNAERQRLRQILKKCDLPAGMGLICRTAGEGKSEELIEQDAKMLMEEWREAEKQIAHTKAPCCVYQEPSLLERSLRDFLTEDVDEIVADNKADFDIAQKTVRRLSREERVKVRLHQQAQPIFRRYKIDRQVESLFSRTVPLPSGGAICVDETEALIAIDVNSGKSRGGKDHPETILNTNLEAAEEVARQLRLRDVGGLVVIDFIDMRERQDQKTVYQAFRDAMAVDRARTKILPISQLGLVEMTRQRQQESLRGRVFIDCPYCSGKGLVKSPISVSVELQRTLLEMLRKRRRHAQLRVKVHPQVLERLKNEDAPLLRELEEECDGELAFRPDETLHLEEYLIQDQKSGDNLYASKR